VPFYRPVCARACHCFVAVAILGVSSSVSAQRSSRVPPHRLLPCEQTTLRFAESALLCGLTLGHTAETLCSVANLAPTQLGSLFFSGVTFRLRDSSLLVVEVSLAQADTVNDDLSIGHAQCTRPIRSALRRWVGSSSDSVRRAFDLVLASLRKKNPESFRRCVLETAEAQTQAPTIYAIEQHDSNERVLKIAWEVLAPNSTRRYLEYSLREWDGRQLRLSANQEALTCDQALAKLR
jgi:hypothetical protein